MEFGFGCDRCGFEATETRNDTAESHTKVTPKTFKRKLESHTKVKPKTFRHKLESHTKVSPKTFQTVRDIAR